MIGKDRVIAETLHMYPGENKQCERRKVVKDFCFPYGILMQTEIPIDSIKRQLDKDRKTNKSSSFLFSLSGT